MRKSSSNKVLKGTMCIISLLMVGCKEKTVYEEVEVIETREVTRPFQISELSVMADSDAVPINSTVTFDVFADTELFDELSRVNLLEQQVVLESTDPDILYISEKERTGFAKKEGTVTVYAHFRGVQSEPLTLEVLPALSSCGEIDNTDKRNSSGACLKVVRGLSGEADDKLFTSTPSLTFLDALNYKREDTDSNSGKSYAQGIVGIGTYATQNAHFGLFRQDGQGAAADGSGGQYDRYCQHLAQLNFLDRGDWRRATGPELLQLFNDLGNLFENYGFFNKSVYWSSSQTMPGHRNAKPFHFFRVGLYQGYFYPSINTLGLGASCVSESELLHAVSS